MNKFLKFAWIIPVLMILFTMFYYPLSVSATYSIIDHFTTSQANIQIAGSNHANTNIILLKYTPSENYNMSDISIFIHSLHKHTGTYETINIAWYTGATRDNLTYIQPGRANTKNLSDLVTNTYNLFTFYSLKVEIGTTYWCKISVYSQSDAWVEIGVGNGDANASGEWWHNNAWGVNWTPLYKTYGFQDSPPEVWTTNATISSSGLTFHGILSNYNVESHVWFEYGTETGVYHDSTKIQTITVNNGTLAYFDDIISPIAQTYYFVAKASVNGLILTGQERTYTVGPGWNPIGDNLGDIVTNKASVGYSDFTVSATINSMAGDTLVDVFIDWGYTPDMTETPITLGTDIDSLGQTSLVKHSGVNNNSNFWYQARMEGDTDTSRGLILQGHTLNPNQPSIISNINLPPGYWWGIMLIIMILPWIFLHSGKMQQVVSVCLDVIILGTFIALSIVDIWIIVLLAVLSGAVIFSVVLKNRTTS